MKAKSISGNSVSNIKSALDTFIAEGFKPTIAVVFISVKQDRKSIISLLNAEGIDVFGATSCGEFINGKQTEGEMAILLMDLSKEL